MSEHHPGGYLKHSRRPIPDREPGERIRDFDHIYNPQWDEQHLMEQGERCMDCGVPTCMGGCPLGNIIPDWNDLVHRGEWKDALQHLHATNNFPEFTGYTCPAPCESSCVLAYNDDAVTIKSIERAIVDKGWEQGWIVPEPPVSRNGYRVAVVGSGPAGLAAAQQLNRVGHDVTVYEKDDAIGGLMTYGIPDFKFAKHLVERRVNQLRQEGIHFKANIEIGRNVSLQVLRNQFDAICVAIGAQKPRDVMLPGRDLNRIVFGMEYLVAENRRQAGRKVDTPINAAGKHVVVLGGGDTGADCVATAHRQGAKTVTQLSIRAKQPYNRTNKNPWPQPERVYKKTYAIEEGGSEEFSLNATAFLDEDHDGRLDLVCMDRVHWSYDENGKRNGYVIVEPEIRIPADLVIIAIGFEGVIRSPSLDTGLELNSTGTIQVDDAMMSSIPGVFAAGDSVRGPSIVVWAIGEGREVARNIDTYLTGTSRLPVSLGTHNAQIHQ